MSTSTANVRTGLDRLVAEPDLRADLDGANVGLLVNPASVTSTLDHAVDVCLECGLDVERLFAPEHGVRGRAQDMEAVEQRRDPLSGLPVVSLYGMDADSLRPGPKHLEDLDVVIADLQDVGARYYTYASTIGYVMDVCGDVGVEVRVLDRPNPITGRHLEGNVVEPSCRSFVGTQPIATRHGMTIGELARFFTRFGGWECNLEVVEMEGWRRSTWFDETDLPWVMPSPNLPALETAIVYPGQCLLEGTNVSEGRGTTRPFELFGAPWIDAPRLGEALAAFELPGVTFRPTSFKPMFQKHAGSTCHGLQLHVRDRDSYRSVATGFAILSTLLDDFGDDFAWRREPYEFVEDRLAIDLLLGDSELRRALEAGEDPLELADRVTSSRENFDARREQCLLYE